MKRILGILLVAASLAVAQQVSSDNRGYVQRVVEIKHADVNSIYQLISGGPASVKRDAALHVIVLFGTPDQVAGAEEAIKKLDVVPKPDPNVELTVYLLSGSSQESVEGAEPPQDLASTVKQLHGLFTYKNYRLIESFVLRGRSGRRADTEGVLPGSGLYYSFRYDAATVGEGNPAVVHINGMLFSIKVPSGHNEKGTVYSNAGLSTDLDAQVGQKVVVGKSSVNDKNDAMILVVTAKVIE